MSSTSLTDALADFSQFVPELRADMDSALKLFISMKGTQFSRRTYLRTFFAQVEATSYALRRLLVAQEILHTTPLEPLERSALLEEGYDVTDDGDVRVRHDRFISPDRSLRLLFRLSAKCFALTYALPVDGPGWKAFRSALRIRNRITHPRSAKDYVVTDDEITDLQTAHTWFMESTQALLKNIQGTLTGQIPKRA